MMLYKVNVKFENSNMPWWENGGAELWDEYSATNKFLVDPEKFLDFFKKSEQIPGFYDGTAEDCKTPFDWKIINKYE